MAGWSFATDDSSPISGQCVKLQALLLLQQSASSIQDTQSNAALISAAIACSYWIHLQGFSLRRIYPSSNRKVTKTRSRKENALY